METLSELWKRNADSLTYISDKGTVHDYIDGYYNKVFNPLKEEPIKLLEIGVLYSDSLKLWKEFFVNGEIWGMDINEIVMRAEGVTILQKDAYTQEALDMFEDGYFDIIIDDGPHTLESQKFFVQHWTKKLKKGGRLILEDIPNSGWLEDFHKIANELGEEGIVHDLRPNKGQHDDLMFEIIKK